MTPDESIYFDSIKNHTAGFLGDKTNIYVGPSCSVQFIDAVSRTFGSKASVVQGNNKLGNKKYGMIIDCPSSSINISKLKDYTNNLLPHGIIAIGTNNRSFIQTDGKQKKGKFRLSAKTDRVLLKHGLIPIFREPLGKFNRLNNSRPNSRINIALSKIGHLFPNSKLYSPNILMIYRRDDNNSLFKRYHSATSLRRRIYRICTRKNILIGFFNFLKALVFGTYYSYIFRTIVSPRIPVIEKEKDKKTLVISMAFLAVGGVERVTLNIIKGIDTSRFTVHLLTTVPNNNAWDKEFRKYVKHIVHVPEIISDKWPEYFRRLYVEKYVSRNQADVLFITNSAAAYRAIPTIKRDLPNIRIYDLLHTHGTPQDKDAFLKISMPFDKYIDRRVVIDKYLKNYYTDKYNVKKSKVLVIYNNIDQDWLKSSDVNAKDPLLEKIPMGVKVITYIGRLDEDKSPMRLIDIAIEIKRRKLPISVVIVGDGSLSDDMTRKAINNEVIDSYVHFYGTSHQPLALANQSDFTLLVSDSEGIPMCILESMSVSTPAIAPAVGGIPEIIDHLSDGILVQINNLNNDKSRVMAFADAIEKACNISKKDYKIMQALANNKISDRFSNMTKQYENLFETGDINDY